MLKLKNIVLNNGVIEADYFPESETELFAHASYDPTTGKGDYTKLKGYEFGYAGMAIQGLMKTIDELNNHEISELPKERTVMWY